MAKSFNEQTERIDQALDQFLCGAKKRSAICLVTNNKEWRGWITLTAEEEERLMLALTSNRKLFDSFFRIVKPVEQFYRRVDAKAKRRKMN